MDSLYIPAGFSEANPERATRLISAYPLASLITIAGQTPYISHVPLLLERPTGLPAAAIEGKLIGHLARANPHAEALADNPDCLAIFRGPDAYISPTLYDSPGVPTWNYTAVHIRGRARIISELGALESLLRRATNHFEARNAGAWTFDLQGTRRDRLLSAIIGFEITIETAEAKFKLSQNRSVVEQQRIREHLRGVSPALAEWMP